MAAEAQKTEQQGLPKRVGRYDAFRHIGTGGMARVYLAVERGLAGRKAELVVLKILRSEVVEDQHVLSLFTDEARIAMRLDHPNIIRTREVLAEAPSYLLAMDFHNGQSLLEVVNRIGRDAVPLREHLYVLCKVLAGLTYAHELKEDGQPTGIVHRDVSPANVLVSYGGEVKLLDFGIAKATGALAATRDGVVRGKLGYAAPEQCLGQPADPRSDIYAVGVMLWEAIAGKRRATYETWQSALQARLEDAEPKLEEACPDAPPALVAIVGKALARDPNDRYPTARAFQGDLEKYLRQNGAPIGARQIAAMLKPHFESDRAELQRAVEGFIATVKSGANTPIRRIPLPGDEPSSPLASSPASRDPATTKAPVQEEQTAPIPIDEALLILSRRDSPAPESSSPTVPPPPAPVAVADAPVLTPATPVADAPVLTPATPVADAPVLTPATPVAVAAAPASLSEASPVLAPTPRAPSIQVDAFGVVVVPQAGSAPAWPVVTPAPPPEKKTAVWSFLGIAVAALVLAAVVVVPRLGSSKQPAAPAAPAAMADSSNAKVAPSAPKVDTVKVRISVDPADALVTLDGRGVSGNPFIATLDMDTEDHELVATADGCKEQRQIIHLTSDLALLVAMKCDRLGMQLTGRRGAAHAQRATTAPSAAPASTTAAPPAAATPVTAP